MTTDAENRKNTRKNGKTNTGLKQGSINRPVPRTFQAHRRGASARLRPRQEVEPRPELWPPTAGSSVDLPECKRLFKVCATKKMTICVYGGGTPEGCTKHSYHASRRSTRTKRGSSLPLKSRQKCTSRKSYTYDFVRLGVQYAFINVRFSFAFSFEVGCFPPRVFESKTARARRVAERAGGAYWPRGFFAAKGWLYGLLRVGAPCCFEDCHEELSSQNTRAKLQRHLKHKGVCGTSLSTTRGRDGEEPHLARQGTEGTHRASAAAAPRAPG